jgi:hypothetical protein
MIHQKKLRFKTKRRERELPERELGPLGRRAEEGSRQNRHDGTEQSATRNWAGHRLIGGQVGSWGLGETPQARSSRHLAGGSKENAKWPKSKWPKSPNGDGMAEPLNAWITEFSFTGVTRLTGEWRGESGDPGPGIAESPNKDRSRDSRLKPKPERRRKPSGLRRWRREGY